MKLIIIIGCLIGFGLIQQDSSLEIDFTNIKQAHVGKKLYVGYWYKKPKDFSVYNTIDFGYVRTIESTTEKIIQDVPNGTCAVSAYVDVNGNGKLDKNLFGAPSEPYCFSKNFKPAFSAPDFEDCAVEVTSDMKLQIKLLN